MPQVTLSTPREKLPLVKDVFFSIGVDKRKIKSDARSSVRNLSSNVNKAGNLLYKKYFDWEYYRNELEFE